MLGCQIDEGYSWNSTRIATSGETFFQNKSHEATPTVMMNLSRKTERAHPSKEEQDHEVPVLFSIFYTHFSFTLSQFEGPHLQETSQSTVNRLFFH